MSFNYIIFDLDGTLTDPSEGIINSIVYALKKMNINFKDREFLKKFIGPPLHESFMKYFNMNKEKAFLAVKYYREYFSEKGIYENKIYPGIKELLMELKNKNKFLILCTSKPTVYAEKILKYFDIYECFNFIKGSNLDGTFTLKEELLKFILEKFKDKNRKEFIFIGDHELDVKAAKKFGIKIIAVTYGFGNFEKIKELKPDFIADSALELLRIFHKII